MARRFDKKFKEQAVKLVVAGGKQVADITYIWKREGWLYLVTVMDLFSRRIIGWYRSNSMNKELVITALERAIGRQSPKSGLIHHSDRGSQYAPKDYQKILRRFKITTSMSRRGNCYDNACIESFHSVIKKELIFHEDYQTRKQAINSIFEYIVSFYNRLGIFCIIWKAKRMSKHLYRHYIKNGLKYKENSPIGEPCIGKDRGHYTIFLLAGATSSYFPATARYNF